MFTSIMEHLKFSLFLTKALEVHLQVTASVHQYVSISVVITSRIEEPREYYVTQFTYMALSLTCVVFAT